MIVTISKVAQADLRTSADWIGRDDPVRAETFNDELLDACAELAEFPYAFPPFPNSAGRPLHRRNHGNYAIIYEVMADEVLVATIVHGARDIDSLL